MRNMVMGRSIHITKKNPLTRTSSLIKMATFTANAAWLGSPDFKVIDIDPEQVAKGLQEYLKRGSQLTGVAITDIDRGVSTVPADLKKVTLVDLLSVGMKLFDAMVWLTAGRPSEYPLTRDPTKTVDSIPSMHDVARSVFYSYFFLLTQARYPVKGGGDQKPTVANFLKVVMGMEEDQSVYISRICSFEPQKFNPSWVKYVEFSNFGQEALSRFGLGVAGYRMFGPFKLYTPVQDLSPEIKAAYDFARKVSMAPPSWDVHPLTRNVNILTSRGNLNKNLNNLIMECFTDEQIAEMVTAKVLYKTPVKEPNYRNYLTWSENDNISGTSQIFR
jgi:hypothetical protein